MYGCTGVQVPPRFHTFYSHAVECVGVDVPYPQNLCVTIFTLSSYYWKLLEPPGTYTTLGFSWICPTPQYLCVIIFPTIRNYWSHLEPIRPQDSPGSALTPLPMRYHFPTAGNYWNHLEPIRPQDSPGCALPPST